MIEGIVPGNPVDLAADKGIDLEVYSLARVGQSEEGMSSDRAKIAVMYACKRHAERQGQTITYIVTRGNQERTDFQAAIGHYGRQGIHPYCTTIAEPKSHTIELAKQVIDGTLPDETDGAQWWDNPFAQAVLAKVHPRKQDPVTGKWTGYYTPDEIAKRRIAKGMRAVVIQGVSTRFWA